jgi:hypothetical protein
MSAHSLHRAAFSACPSSVHFLQHAVHVAMHLAKDCNSGLSNSGNSEFFFGFVDLFVFAM